MLPVFQLPHVLPDGGPADAGVALGVVELLYILKRAFVVVGHEVDGNSLTTESASSSNPVNVVLPVGGQVVVDDERDLLDVNPPGQEVGGDPH